MGVTGITLRLCPPTRGAAPKEQTLRTIAGRMLNVGGGSFDCRAASNKVPILGALLPFGIDHITISPDLTRGDHREATLITLMNIFKIATETFKGSLAERLSKANLGIDLNLQGCGVWGAKAIPASASKTAEVRPVPVEVPPPRTVKKSPKTISAVEVKAPKLQPGKFQLTAFEMISLPLTGIGSVAGLIGGEILHYLGAAKLFLALDFVGAAVSFIFFCALAGIARARRNNIMLKGLVYLNDKVFGENSRAMKQGLIEIGLGRGVPLETIHDIRGHERTVARRKEQDLLDKLLKRCLPETRISSIVTSNHDGVHGDLLYFQDNYENGYRRIHLLELRERLF